MAGCQIDILGWIDIIRVDSEMRTNYEHLNYKRRTENRDIILLIKNVRKKRRPITPDDKKWRPVKRFRLHDEVLYQAFR